MKFRNYGLIVCVGLILSACGATPKTEPKQAEASPIQVEINTKRKPASDYSRTWTEFNSKNVLIEPPVGKCQLINYTSTIVIGENTSQLFVFNGTKVAPGPKTKSFDLKYYFVNLPLGDKDQKVNPTQSIERARTTLAVLQKSGHCNPENNIPYINNDYSELDQMISDATK